jgi:hypothetical protein
LLVLVQMPHQVSGQSDLERRRKLKFSKTAFIAISPFFWFVCLFTIRKTIES